ncbi:MAG: DNA-binding protein [Acidimicrobiales bacterium]
MGRRLDVEHLVGAAEVARRLGLARAQQVHLLRRSDPSFPPPVHRVGTGERAPLIWYWPEVRRWARRHRVGGRR